MTLLSFFGLKPSGKRNSRRFQRVRIPLLIRYQLDETGEGKVSNLNDLAAGGVRFTSDEPVASGTRLKLCIKLPWRDRPLYVIGKVTRCLKLRETTVWRIATRFVGMKKEDTAEIESFVDALANERQRVRRR